MKKITISFDTSNYTTSCAFFDGENGDNSGRLLDVPAGALGLRQSEALFSHVKRLPEIFDELKFDGEVIAVGASTKPRETEDSYMPCFLAGAGQARVLAKTLNVPFFAFSHQQGHIAAAAYSAGDPELMDREHLAWHLSGGTTELLHVVPDGCAVKCEIIGGTSDVSAGQLIDRAGQLMALQFPSGKMLDKLASEASKEDFYLPKFSDMKFSLSGVEHKMKTLLSDGESHENVSYYVLRSLCETVRVTTDRALKKYGDIPVLFSGGVASNSLLRKLTPEGIFAEPRYSTDNAYGIAILTYRAVMEK